MSALLPLTVAEAASRLGVTPRRVRAMIRDAELEASKAGGAWFIDPAAVSRRLHSKVDSGRLLSPRHAWALLWMKSGEPSLERMANRWLGDWARWYLLDRGTRDVWGLLAPRLRRRASTLRLRAHPSDLRRLASEPKVVLTGVSAAAEHGLDIADPGILEAYAPATAVPKLRRKFLLEPSSAPNVILHSVDTSKTPWPFPAAARIAPAVLVALDLLDSGDGRSARAARTVLK